MASNNFYFSDDDDVEVEDGDGTSSRRSPKSARSATNSSDEDESLGDEDQSDLDDDIELADEENDEPVKSKSKSKQPKDEDLEEEEEDTEEEEDEEDEEENDNELSSITLVARDLVQKGVLKPKEGVDYEDSDKGLAKLVEDTKAAELLEDVPEEYASILDAIKQGIPVSDWITLVAPDEDLKNVDLDDEDNQEILVARLLEKNGLTEEQIDKKITRFKKLDTLREEAEDAQTILIKEDEKLKAENNRKIIQNKQESEKKQKATIDKIYADAEKLTEIQGVFLNKKERKELADYTTKAVNSRGETQYMIDRNDPELLLQAAYLVKNAKNNVIQKVAKSKATKDLRKQLDSRTDRMSSGRGRNTTSRGNQGKMSGGVLWDADKEIED